MKPQIGIIVRKTVNNLVVLLNCYLYSQVLTVHAVPVLPQIGYSPEGEGIEDIEEVGIVQI
jgi:hypothetical protein